MAGMDDLVTWLRAQLDDDERVALAATAGPWRHDATKHWRKPGTTWFEESVFAGPAGADATCVAGTGEADDPQSMADARHIARWDPARVLAEVEAKRRIVDWLVDCADKALHGDWWNLEVDDAFKAIALPYAARPGYREEWRP
jgi:hypothetical protein